MAPITSLTRFPRPDGDDNCFVSDESEEDDVENISSEHGETPSPSMGKPAVSHTQSTATTEEEACMVAKVSIKSAAHEENLRLNKSEYDLPANMVNPTKLRFSDHMSRRFGSERSTMSKCSEGAVSLATSECLRRYGCFEDHYRIESELGSGSFGVVYKVKCLTTGRLFAMKKVNAKSGNSGAAEDEISHSCEFDHPYLVKLHSFYRQTDHYQMVMDLCTGGDLRTFCAGRITALRQANKKHIGGIGTKLAARFFHQMLNGVAFLHFHGFAHRDIKPENFLRSHNGSNAVLKLADFGFAVHVPEGGKLTKVVGTAHYAAPELLDKWYDEQVDVWSLGVSTFGMCTNKLPFDGVDEQDYLQNLKAKRFRKREKDWRDVCPRLRHAVFSTLEFDPERRPTAQAVLSANPWLRSGDDRCVVS